MLFFAATLALPNSGCASGLRLGSLGFGDALLESYRDQVWAKRAYNLRYNNCDRPYETHFQNGFIAGYCDTCNGGDGYVPALPPDDYRGFEYQSPDGAQCVKSWFEGFPAGVAAAKKDRAGEFHDIYTSRMINSAITQEKSNQILPTNVPVARNNASANGQKQVDNGSPVHLDNGIVGAENRDTPTSVPYVAPPSTSENPLLKPRLLTPSDLVEAPTIRKTGPTAMAPVSKMQQFTIDPAVKIEASTAAPTATYTERVAKNEFTPLAVPVKDVVTNASTAITNGLPPIVSTARSQIVAPVLPPIVEPVATAVKTVTAPQTPLPMAVRSAGSDWRSQTSSRRR